MDRQTIRNEVRRQVNEPDSGGRWSDTDYNNVIERAQEDFAIKTKCLKTYAETTLTEGQKIVNVDESSLSNFIDLAEVWYFIDTNKYRTLIGVSRDELSAMQSEMTDVEGYPNYYCYEDRTIEFDKEAPSADTLRIYYYKLPDSLSDDTSVPDIPVKFHQALVYYVCWKFFESDDLNLNNAMYFKQQYFDEVIKAMSVLNPRNANYGGIKDDTELGYYA